MSPTLSRPDDRGYAALAAAVRLAIDSRSDSPSASASASSSYASTATLEPTPTDSSITYFASEPGLPATRQADELRTFGHGGGVGSDATRPSNGVSLAVTFAVVLAVVAIISYRWGRVAYEALRSVAVALTKRVAHWRLQ